jgi:hypothetical protein
VSPRLTVVSARSTPTRVARSAAVVMGATLASTMLGFAREVLNARYFGASGSMDAFLAAATIPTILFGVSTARWSARSFRSSPSTSRPAPKKKHGGSPARW